VSRPGRRGSNNETLLADPLYLGLRQPRVRGNEYDAFLEAFVMAMQVVFPRCCITWGKTELGPITAGAK
jgi:hypothetical protein